MQNQEMQNIQGVSYQTFVCHNFWIHHVGISKNILGDSTQPALVNGVS